MKSINISFNTTVRDHLKCGRASSKALVGAMEFVCRLQLFAVEKTTNPEESNLPEMAKLFDWNKDVRGLLYRAFLDSKRVTIHFSHENIEEARVQVLFYDRLHNPDREWAQLIAVFENAEGKAIRCAFTSSPKAMEGRIQRLV